MGARRSPSLPLSLTAAFAFVGLMGCDSGPSPEEPALAENGPTFARDIAPVVYEKCAGCHRPGEAGPFPLLTYDDVRRRAQLIEVVTQSRYMPPWLPDPGHGDFEGVRSLSDEQIALISEWVAAGTPEGDPSETPPLPEWTEGWQLGEPDLVIRMPEAYNLPADGPDIFRSFAIPIPVSDRKYVKGFEFRPDNPKIVHHARMLLDQTGRSRQHDADDPKPGFGDSMFVDEIFDPSGHWIGWTPGKQPALRSPDIAWPLAPGTDLVLEMHMVPTGKPERIQSSFGFYFSDQKPTRTPFIVRFGSKTIDIPPGEEHYVIEDRYVLPVGVEVLSVYPHAHYLATEMEGQAILPDGTKQPLLRISQWNFDWQDEYRYDKPPFLPKGAAIEMRFVYDNSADNPRNPNDPPVRITYGWQTSEEMGDLWFQVVPRREEDWEELSRDFGRKERRAQIAGYEKQLETHPEDYEKHNALGNLYLENGDVDGAAPRFQRALSIKPDYPYAHYNLGIVSESHGKMTEAIGHYRNAIRYKPDHAPSHNNLAIGLFSQGDPAAAIRHLRQAITADKNYAEAHSNLGIALGSQGDFDGAIRAFQTALRLDPEYAEAHNNLANTFAAMGQLDKAIRHYQTALEIVPDYADARRNLERAESAKAQKP
jgi:tetratricopeptide (TPR) repeat protein/mono/diheme cytochrome c family protein